MSSSGAQMSARPKENPKVVKPMVSRARLPAKTKRSAQEMALPYFCLMGSSRRRALSRLPLSGQEFSGAKRWAPVPAPPRPSVHPVGAGGVPAHADEEPAVVTPVGGPPLLGVGHEGVDVTGQLVEVDPGDRFCVVEVGAERSRGGMVLVQDPQVQLVRPPLLVGLRLARGEGTPFGPFGLRCRSSLLLISGWTVGW